MQFAETHLRVSCRFQRSRMPLGNINIQTETMEDYETCNNCFDLKVLHALNRRRLLMAIAFLIYGRLSAANGQRWSRSVKWQRRNHWRIGSLAYQRLDRKELGTGLRQYVRRHVLLHQSAAGDCHVGSPSASCGVTHIRGTIRRAMPQWNQVSNCPLMEFDMAAMDLQDISPMIKLQAEPNRARSASVQRSAD